MSLHEISLKILKHSLHIFASRYKEHQQISLVTFVSQKNHTILVQVALAYCLFISKYYWAATIVYKPVYSKRYELRKLLVMELDF